MDSRAVPGRDCDRPTRSKIASIAIAIGVLSLLVAASGCDEGPRIIGAQREFDERVADAKENARERQAAHRRALRVERAMHPRLRSSRHPTADCRVEYAPIRPQQGIAPIACGNLHAAWPLTVKRGYLRCEPSIRKNVNRVIFTAPNGAEYAVNRSAHGVGYLGIDVIWKQNPKGEKADLEPLRKRGLSPCEQGR